ncbi:hypothetical protein [Paenibacillus lautus]|uniref:hypothetical protein n=1 Tax=Paenibacillus lautus TaxID=1401 RepID=UPI002DBDEB5F|nr:hypothetical protein [Paenibacillus lautus]MEC0257735.1 hypothetical protein [Paenibacillus lautus]
MGKIGGRTPEKKEDVSVEETWRSPLKPGKYRKKYHPVFLVSTATGADTSSQDQAD